MASSTLPSIGLVSLILFVLPGLAGIKLALRLSKRGDWLNRVDTVVASVGLAVSSLVGFYLIVSLMMVLLTVGYNRRVRTIEFNDVARIAGNLDMLFLSYLTVFVLNILGGLLLYHTDFLYGKFSSNRTWKVYDQMVAGVDESDSYVVRVRTTIGDEIRGVVEDKDDVSLNGDILLHEPRVVRYGDEGQSVDEYRLENGALVKHDDIVHVGFESLSIADKTPGGSQQDEMSEDEVEGEMNELIEVRDAGQSSKVYELEEEEESDRTDERNDEP